ncbi:MAG: class I SAM-dependent methyltransferase [Pseudomonadota bacterium]
MSNDDQSEYWNGPAGQRWVDHSNRLEDMLAPFAERVLEVAEIQAGEHVLDIGCGAGLLTMKAAQTAGGALGVDISAPLIVLARQRASRDNSIARFKLADASVFSTETKADVVASRFGVMFFDDPVAAFANIKASTKSEGRLCFACWQAMPLNEWVFAPLQATLPLLKEPPTPPAPNEPGPFAFANKDRVAELLTQAGWTNISIEPFTPPIKLPADDIESTAKFTLGIGPLSRVLEEQNLEPAAIEAALVDQLSSAVTDDGFITMGSAAWIVCADAG